MLRLIVPLLAIILNLNLLTLQSASAENRFIGEIRFFGGNYAPEGWAFCDGQLLLIDDHSALYAVLGTTYGGDGRTTFALPDMRSRSPLHVGRVPGLPETYLGQREGNPKTVFSTKASSSEGGIPISAEGQSRASSTYHPFVGVNCIIALTGDFPPRS